MGVKEMHDVVAHHICSSDPDIDITSLEDVEKAMALLGFGCSERFETPEGSWLRFLRDRHNNNNSNSSSNNGNGNGNGSSSNRNGSSSNGNGNCNGSSSNGNGNSSSSSLSRDLHHHHHHHSSSACNTASEHAYQLKLPIHLHVAPQPDLHFAPFLHALRFFADAANKPLPFHLKNIDCEAIRCRYLTGCKELYGLQRAPPTAKEY